MDERLTHFQALDGFSDKEVQRFLYWVRVEGEKECWFWAGYRDPRGYGRFCRSVAANGGRPVAAHRLSYEMFIGPIPNGYQVHHLCINPSCCRPDHLEALDIPTHVKKTASHASNQTHCIRGHEFTPENTRMYRGGRTCRACVAARWHWGHDPDYIPKGPHSRLYCMNQHPLFGENMELIPLVDGRFRRRCKTCRRETALRFKIDNAAAILAAKTLRRADTIAGRRIQHGDAIVSLAQTAHMLPTSTLISTLRRLLNDCA